MKWLFNKFALMFVVIAVISIVAIYTSVRSSGEQNPRPSPDVSQTTGADMQPSPELLEGWKTVTQNGISYRYPEALETDFISPTDWPPQIEYVNEIFSCTEAGNEIERAGKTERTTINGTEYCVSAVAEGAAGSTYRTYTYSRSFDEGTLYTRLSLRFPQCMNYDDAKRSECTNEQDMFDINALADTISKSIQKN